MSVIYSRAEPPKRWAQLQSRSAMRDRLGNAFAGMDDLSGSLEVRVRYTERTSPPVPDFPELQEGFVLSERATAVAPDGLLDMFRLIPLAITGGARVMRRSEIWYESPDEEWKKIKGIDQKYFLLKATSAFMPDKPDPVKPEMNIETDADGEASMDATVKWLQAGFSEMHAMPANLAAFFATREPPMLFAFGSAGRPYFTEKFVQWVKKNKLTGLTYEEVARNQLA